MPKNMEQKINIGTEIAGLIAMKDLFSLIMRTSNSPAEDIIGLSAIIVMLMVALHIPSVL